MAVKVCVNDGIATPGFGPPVGGCGVPEQVTAYRMLLFGAIVDRYPVPNKPRRINGQGLTRRWYLALCRSAEARRELR